MKIELQFKKFKNERENDFVIQVRNWMKSVIYFNYEKKNHIMKYYNHDKNENFSSKDKKFRKTVKSWRKKIKKKAVMMQLFINNSESAVWKKWNFMKSTSHENDKYRD